MKCPASVVAVCLLTFAAVPVPSGICGAAASDSVVVAARRGVASSTTRDGWLMPNALRIAVSNQGQFALDHEGFRPGVEYPAGSGKFAAFAGGLWVSGTIAGSARLAIAEFGSEYSPGDIEGGAAVTDTARFAVYSVVPYDTAGWGAWAGRAAPLGAPTAAGGTRPRVLGDQTLWTVFNDAGRLPESPVRGSARMSPPIGLEVRLTAWAFHRDGPLDRTAFLAYEVIHRGSAVLDGARIGLFFDPHVGGGAQLAACDTALDLGYSFHVGTDATYGMTGPAVGLAVLDPPRDPASGALLRPSAYVAYANGSDPSSAAEFANAMQGRLPGGAAIVDSSTLQVTTYFSSGDPVSGGGWVQSYPNHPHTVLTMGPCSFAPLDTLRFVVALAVGEGVDALAGVTDLRAIVREAKRSYAADFAGVPPIAPRPLRAWPNPSSGTQRFSYSVGPKPEWVEFSATDLAGRRIWRSPAHLELPGSREAGWVGMCADGHPAPQGLYLVRARIGGRPRAVVQDVRRGRFRAGATHCPRRWRSGGSRVGVPHGACRAGVRSASRDADRAPASPYAGRVDHVWIPRGSERGYGGRALGHARSAGGIARWGSQASHGAGIADRGASRPFSPLRVSHAIRARAAR